MATAERQPQTEKSSAFLYGIPLKEGGIAKPNEAVPYKNFDLVGYKNTMENHVRFQRQSFERSWYRNVLFYLGKQWIVYDSNSSRWVKPNMPAWYPLPVTNRFAATVDAMASVLDSVNPEMVYSPRQDDQAALATADICNDIVDIIKEEIDYKQAREVIKHWLSLTADVFLIPYYSNSMEYGSVFIPDMRCQACGFSGSPDVFQDSTCPACGTKGQQVEFANPETGKPSGVEFPRGKMCLDIASSFEIYADMQASSIEKSPFVIRAKKYNVDDIRRMWPEKAAEIIPESKSDMLSQEYLSAIAYTTNSIETDFFASPSSGQRNDADRATVWQIWLKPSVNFPEGCYGVLCGNTVLEEPKALPYRTDEGTPFINIIQIKWNNVDGRLFSKTPADDLIHKQVQRNKIESFIMMCQGRMANPVWLIPQTSGVNNITGEPGEKITYNDSGTLKAKPERIGGVEIPTSTFRYLEKIDQDFEELAATYDIIKGSVPKNVPTLGGLEVLKERGLSRFGRAINNFERANIILVRMLLWIWKEYATEHRTKVSAGNNQKWEIKQFNNSNLTGNINVGVEPGTSNPKSESYQQYIAGQLLANGLIDPKNPFTRAKILQRFHATEFAKDLDADIKDAIKEQETFKETGQVRLRPLIDNNELHLETHKMFAKTEEFFNMPEQLQSAMYQHIQAHFAVIMQQQQMSMQGQQGQQQQGSASAAKQLGEMK